MNDTVAIGNLETADKLKPCRYCKELINADANVCKYCQKNQNFIMNHFSSISVIISILMVLLTFMQLMMAKSEAEDAQKAKMEANSALEKAVDSANMALQAKTDATIALGKAIDSANQAQLAKIDAQTALAESKKNRKASMEQELRILNDQIKSTHESWLTNEDYKNAICSNIGVSPSTPHLLLEPQKTNWKVAQQNSDRLAKLKTELETRAISLEQRIKDLTE